MNDRVWRSSDDNQAIHVIVVVRRVIGRKYFAGLLGILGETPWRDIGYRNTTIIRNVFN
jgi:hypothetical protein